MFAQDRRTHTLSRWTAGTLLLVAASALPLQAQADGERAWAAGQEAALRGQADSAMSAYGEAVRLARQDLDRELESAARLGMAEVWDVWRRCTDSARAAYQDAVLLSSEFDYAAADAFVLWLARRGDQAAARALHARAYLPIETQVPRSVTRESINFLLGLAAIQIANKSQSGAMSSLRSARSIAARLAAGGGDTTSAGAVRRDNYWVLHDIADLQINGTSQAVRNRAAGRALRKQVDAATSVPDDGMNPRFSVGRLADRVAQARRVCTMAACRLPPPPRRSRCR